ncbi:hypothetical protein EYZ11_007989 [Aspergillus tanneri]|uniref:Importin-7/11-like TPR repeats domain-containing protein n=1 Tax=Aspergillus tanneri TaxID=1220188 RepID=A0A4S3JBM6_9EURO|nr:hypothetical protein EYZ11_007989 [Aspergillus tanneri]
MAFNPAQSFRYQTPQDREEKKASIELIKSQLFTHDFVVNVMELLVTQFFRLRKSEFQEWEEDPEEWERKEEDISDAWEFSIRSCSEKVFLELVIHFKDLLIPRLLSVFYSFASLEKRDILLKDSLYSAIGLAAASLEQHLDFNNFLETTLVPEVQIQEQGYNLLRRRIAILLGQWIPVKSSELNKEATYQIFQHLLNRQDALNDLVVRITAGRQLKSVFDPFEFSASGFMPYAPSILQNLMALVQEVELSETKMGLLDSVRTAVVKMEDHLSQALYVVAIVARIADLLTGAQETLIYLLEEALELWSAILTQTPSPASPEIHALIPALFPILEAAMDSAPQALQIAESYIYLAPQEILSDRIRLPLLASFEALLKSTTKQRLGIVPRLVELMIRGAEAVDGGSENTYNVISRTLIDSSFLPALLEGLYSAHEASQTTGPNRKQTSVYGVVETDYLSVLARLALAHPKIFTSSVSAATGTSEEQVLTWILTEWFLHYDNIGSATQKKLHALALTQLLTLNGPDSQPPAYILNHLQSYLNIWTDIITELAEGTENNGDYLIYWNSAETGRADENEPPENTRRREWQNSDILHKINIRDFVRERLRSLIAGCGGEQRFQEEWLINVDREVVSAFGALGLF